MQLARLEPLDLPLPQQFVLDEVRQGPSAQEVTIVAHSERDYRIFLWRPSNGQVTSVLDDQDSGLASPSWSLDGRYLGVMYGDYPHWQYYVCEPRTERSWLAIDTDMLIPDDDIKEDYVIPPFPALSPDGSRIAVCRPDPDEIMATTQLYLVNRLRRSTWTRLTSNPDTSILEPCWRHDAGRIAFIEHQCDRSRLVIANAAGRLLHQYDEVNFQAPSWSHDGRKIAAVGQEGPADLTAGIWSGESPRHLVVLSVDNETMTQYSVSGVTPLNPLWLDDSSILLHCLEGVFRFQPASTD